MKIIYDAKRAFHNSSGLGNYSRDLIRMMAEKWPDSEFILLNPKPSKRTPFVAPNIREIRPKRKTFGTFWRLFRAFKIANQNKGEIFHGLSNELPYGNDYGIKKIVTIHDVIFLRHPEWYKSFDCKIYRKKTLKACEKADVIIAISEQTKSDLIEFLNVPSSKIQVVYQTCHKAFITQYSEEELEDVRKRYHLPTSFLLNVGTIEPRKNAFSIVKALKDIPEIPLVIIGRKTDYYQQIETFSKQNKLEDRIFTPKVDSMEDLAMIYQMANVFIYPSLFEGFGIPIIEALFSNTPVITNKNGVFPEAAGPHSYYCDINNIKSISDQIKYVLENPIEVESACKESRIFAEKFTQATLANQWANIYNQLLDS
ncbi:MAG: glycosyltransferase family 4 protein [Flavobacteriales bacterium]